MEADHDRDTPRPSSGRWRLIDERGARAAVADPVLAEVVAPEAAVEDFALLSPQLASWMDTLFVPDAPVQTTGAALWIDGAIDYERLVRSITLTVVESDALRVRVVLGDGNPRQSVQAISSVDLPLVDFSPAPDPEAEARRWMDTATRHVFRWDDWPLYRFAVLRVGPERHVWCQTFHHLVIDASGRQLLAARTAEHYRAIGSGIPAPGHRAAPFSAAVLKEEAYLASPAARDDRAYFLARLADPPDSPVSTDRRGSERYRSGRPDRLRYAIGNTDFDALRAAAKLRNTTAFRVVLTLMHIAFGRLYGCWDLVSGVVLHGRDARFRRTIGSFARVMPFRLSLARTSTVAEAIGLVARQLNADYVHRRYPAQELHQALGVGMRGRSLVDVALNYLTMANDMEFGGTPARSENLSHGLIQPWLITVTDRGVGHDVGVTVDYDAGIISDVEANRLGRCLLDLIAGALVDGDTVIGTGAG